MIFDEIYNIINVFFPSTLLDIPFFSFLVNLLFFAFCCFIFCIFFVYPVWWTFKGIKRLLK